MKTLFFRRSGPATPPPPLEAGYAEAWWNPGGFRVVPAGLPRGTYSIWWLFHRTHLFRNRGFGVLRITSGDILAHHSTVFPPYFTFPFMARPDLQIGNVWTHPDHRGKNLAVFALFWIVSRFQRPDRTFWYLTSEENRPSIRVAEKAGFRLEGTGVKRRRFGFRLFGAYEREEAGVSSPDPKPRDPESDYGG